MGQKCKSRLCSGEDLGSFAQKGFNPMNEHSVPETNENVNKNALAMRPCTDAERLDPKSKCRKSRTYAELKKYVTHTPKDIVARLNPAESVNIVVGESGEGKTPLWMQKAICVAAGIPFLEQEVQQGPVLWVDFENG